MQSSFFCLDHTRDLHWASRQLTYSVQIKCCLSANTLFLAIDGIQIHLFLLFLITHLYLLYGEQIKLHPHKEKWISCCSYARAAWKYKFITRSLVEKDTILTVTACTWILVLLRYHVLFWLLPSSYACFSASRELNSSELEFLDFFFCWRLEPWYLI